MSNNQFLKDIPPWFQHFLKVVVKRITGILNKYIEDVEEANEDKKP